MKIFCVSCITKDGSSKLFKIDKDLSFISELGPKHPLSWIPKSLETLKAPNQKKLSPCSFHSLTDSQIEKGNFDTCYNYASNGPLPEFCIWNDKYIAFDCCEYDELKLKEEKHKYHSSMSHLFDFYERWYNPFERDFENFFNVLNERNKLIKELKVLEFKTKASYESLNIQDRKFQNYYQVLKSCESKYEETKASAFKRYSSDESLKKKYDFDDYLNNTSKEEIENLEKARSMLNFWLAQNGYVVSKKSDEKMSNLENQISEYNKRLYDNFFLSYQSMLVTRKNLEMMSEYASRVSKYKDQIQLLKVTLDKINNRIDLYKEFKGDLDEKAILDNYYRDLKQSEEIKKKQADKSKVKALEQHKNMFVVKADGSIGIDTNEGPKLVVGQAVTSYGELEDEKWSNLRK